MFWVLENVKPVEAIVSYWLFSTNQFLVISWGLLLIDKIAKDTGGEGSHPLECGSPFTIDQGPTWCHLEVPYGTALGSSIPSGIWIPIKITSAENGEQLMELWRSHINILQKKLKAANFKFTGRFSNVHRVWSVFKFWGFFWFVSERQHLCISLFCLCLARYSGKYTYR